MGGNPSPSFFLFAIPAVGNGINTFSSSLVSTWLKLQGFQKYVAGGVVLRSAITFAVLSGTNLLPAEMAQNGLKLLLAIYIAHLAYSMRGTLASWLGIAGKARVQKK